MIDCRRTHSIDVVVEIEKLTTFRTDIEIFLFGRPLFIFHPIISLNFTISKALRGWHGTTLGSFSRTYQSYCTEFV